MTDPDASEARLPRTRDEPVAGPRSVEPAP
jgi:hypothetical protein